MFSGFPCQASAAALRALLRQRRLALLAWLCLAAGTAAWSSSAAAETYAGGVLKLLRTGWNADSFAIVLDTPVLNPAHCPIADGYLSESDQPGYDTFLDAALAAYRTGNPISIVVDAGACLAGRPRIVGINPAPRPPPPPPQPHQETLILYASRWVENTSIRRFSDVPVIGAFIGQNVDCTHGYAYTPPRPPDSGPGIFGEAGWGQVEGNGHPDGGTDPCTSWVWRFGFDFNATPLVLIPGNKTVDRAILRYSETALQYCAVMVYTQGGFLADAGIPCWSNGDGAPEDKPDGCVALRTASVDWNDFPRDQPIPLTDMTFAKAGQRGAWDVTDLFRQRLNPGLQPPPELGSRPLGFGYILVGTPLDTSNLTAEDNTRCSSYISDVRLELTVTITPPGGGTPEQPH